MTARSEEVVQVERPERHVTVVSNERAVVVEGRDLAVVLRSDERHVAVSQSEAHVVAVGQQGPPGVQGPAGPPGGGLGSGDLNFLYSQGTPTNIWVIVHNLGKNPSVTVVDSGGSEVSGAIQYDTVNQVTITFTASFSGNAYLN